MLARASLAVLFSVNALAVGHLGLTSVGSLSTVPNAAVQMTPRYLNPLGIALDPDGRRAYVALNGADAIAEVDLVAGYVLRRIPCGKSPRAVAYHLGALCVLDDEPNALVIAPGQETGRRVPVAELSSDLRATLFREPPSIFPRERPNGQPVVVPILSTIIPTATPRHHKTAPELLKSGVVDNVLAVNEQWLTGLPPIATGFQIGGGIGGIGGINGAINGGIGGIGGIGGWSGSSGQFGISGGQLLGRRVPLDGDTRGAALPAQAVAHPWSDTVFVSATGSDCVLEVNGGRVREFFGDAKNQNQFVTTGGFGSGVGFAGGQQGSSGIPGAAPAPGQAPATATPTQPGYIVQRLATQAAPGPMALSADGNTLVVSNMLADSLTVIECRPKARVVRHIALGGPRPEAARRGEILFHSARLANNGRFACATCHPGGGTDSFPWHMPTGDGAARVPRPLRGVRDTAPYGWHGEDASLDVHVRKTLTALFEYEPSDREVSDLVAYLESLAGPEPVPTNPAAVAMVERGSELFEGKAQCARCHRGESLQDRSPHDVGTGGEFDVPSLRGVGRRMPLLHDGRAMQVGDIFQRHNGAHKHGAAHTLSPQELSDLLAYVTSR